MKIGVRKSRLQLIGIGIVGFIFLAHYLILKITGYPFLYCWFHGPVFYVYDALATLFVAAGFVYMVYGALIRRIPVVLIGFATMAVALTIPQYAAIIFQAGGRCS